MPSGGRGRRTAALFDLDAILQKQRATLSFRFATYKKRGRVYQSERQGKKSKRSIKEKEEVQCIN